MARAYGGGKGAMTPKGKPGLAGRPGKPTAVGARVVEGDRHFDTELIACARVALPLIKSCNSEERHVERDFVLAMR